MLDAARDIGVTYDQILSWYNGQLLRIRDLIDLTRMNWIFLLLKGDDIGLRSLMESPITQN